jgi:hypothetical protein
LGGRGRGATLIYIKLIILFIYVCFEKETNK